MQYSRHIELDPEGVGIRIIRSIPIPDLAPHGDRPAFNRKVCLQIPGPPICSGKAFLEGKASNVTGVQHLAFASQYAVNQKRSSKKGMPGQTAPGKAQQFASSDRLTDLPSPRLIRKGTSGYLP